MLREMFKYIILATLFFATFCYGQSPLMRIKADPDNHWLLDEVGRVRIFHGVNSVEKGFPWYNAEYMLNETRLDHLKEWGMNVVRLGCMWSGVEPLEDQFNETYIGILQAIVSSLEERGIYTLLDMHQDVMSTKYDSYDGVPLWLVDQYPEPENPYPWPLEEVNNWEQGYLTQATSEGFQYFYDNSNSSITEWAEFWGKVAMNFTGNPAVLGYDLMNEPWIGDYIENLNLSLPGYAAQVNLVDNYDSVSHAIREYDQEGLVFFEPIIYGQLKLEPIRGSGFFEVPGGEDYRNVSAYSFHVYCWPLESTDANTTEEEIEEAARYCEEEFLPQMIEAAYTTVNRTGGSLFLTEFGLCDTGNDTSHGLECRVFLEIADNFLVSWTEWDYNDRKFYDGHGNAILDKVAPYARPYAMAVAGIPTLMNFNLTTLEFMFEFTLNVDIPSPTEIFIPRMHFGCGYDVHVSPNLQWSPQAQSDVIIVYPDPTALSGETGSVFISPGPACL